MPRSRPKGNNKPQVSCGNDTEKKEFTCMMCGEVKPNRDFYKSFNPVHQTGKLPYCKQCLKNMCISTLGNLSVDKFKEMLKLIDRPYLYDIFETSYQKGGDIIGIYFKNLGMPQYRSYTWKDSSFEPNNVTPTKKPDLKIEESEYEVTQELIDKWGYGYKPYEYQLFENKWNKMIDNYGRKTTFHIENLITYIRFRVKEEIATASGNSKEAKEWANMAAKAAEDAKINVRQLSKSDISGGIDLVPQIFEAVESKVGIIPILPKLREQPYDDADLIIWCIVNYIRRLEDKPRIKYKDVYNFYDEMIEEYYMQQGFDTERIKKEKEKRNNVFRDLELIYKEPVYEDGDQ